MSNRNDAPLSTFQTSLIEHIRAGYHVLLIPTTEENRVEREIAGALDVYRVTKGNKPMILGFWDQIQGFSGGVTKKDVFNPTMALRHIATAEDSTVDKNAVTIFRDLHNFYFDNPDVRRVIRWMSDHTQLINEKHNRPVIILQPSLRIHPDIAAAVTVMEFSLPTAAQLRSTVEWIRDGIQNEEKRSCPPELMHHIVQSLRGLTSTEAANCLSLCLIRHGGFVPELIETIEQVKAGALKKSDILSYTPRHMLPSMRDLGGYDELNQFVAQRALAYGPQAAEVNLDLPKGIIIIGVPGCIAEDSQIEYLRGDRKSSGGRRLCIKDFHDKFNGIKTSTRGWTPDLDTYIQSFDAESGKVFYNRVKGVYAKGRKHCIRITTALHGSVTLTCDHPVLNAEAVFVPAGELQEGDRLLVRGDMKPRSADAPTVKRRERVVVEGLKHHPTAWKKSVIEKTTGKEYVYGRTHRARLVFEAHMNGLSYDDFVRILKEEPAKAETLVYLPAEAEVHHVNEDSMDDRLANLMLLSKPDHTRLHCDEERFNVEYSVMDTVTRIETIGEMETYDVSMELPSANFVVNDGIIVHNTGKSRAAESIASRLELPLVRFDFSAVFNALVGESERRVREVIAQVEAMDGCVLFIDEADKAMGGSTEASGDSGVTRRVFGQLLTWLAKKSDRTFVVMTMNRVTGMPPELLRKGRFDEIFYVDVPTPEERRSIFEIHFGKRNVDKDTYTEAQWGELVQATHEFVGAEIEETIKSARLTAFELAQIRLLIDRHRSASGAEKQKLTAKLSEYSTELKTAALDLKESELASALKAVPTLQQLLDSARMVGTTRIMKVDEKGIKAIREFGQDKGRAVSSAANAPRTKTSGRTQRRISTD